MGVSNRVFSYPVVGFRKDRSGARLISLLDMIRLSQKFGVETRFLWLSQPEGPWPELADPHVFFEDALIKDHIKIINQEPDFSGIKSLASVAHLTQSGQFAQALSAGERFYGGGIIEVARFSDENRESVSAELRDIMLNLPLAPRLQAALQFARQALAAAGQKKAAAIHVRRGDILDGDPWSYRAWPSKYVPNEYFRQFVAMYDGPVIAFSDTPAAVRHLAQGDPRILPIDDLLASQELTLPERDMLELLLMAECKVIAAPSASAFSQAAAMIGGAQVLALPGGLGSEHGQKAHDDLLARSVAAPDSFFAPGDLAQSLVYATQHAVAQGRAAELLAPKWRPEGFEQRFPFVQYWSALAAYVAGKPTRATRVARKALTSPHLRRSERLASRQLMGLAALQAECDEDHETRFLTLAFSGAGGAILPVLAYQILMGGGAASQALMFPPELVRKLAYQASGGVLGAVAHAGRRSKGMVLPDWTYQSGWVELMPPGYERENLSRTPGLWNRISICGDLPKEVLTQLADGATPAYPGPEQHMLLGFSAVQMGLHGRLRRAFSLLHWLNEIRPGDALTHKRLADCCYQVGNVTAAQRWLNSAISLAPDNPLLRLSAGQRALAQGQFADARQHILRAKGLLPGLELTKNALQNLKSGQRKLRADSLT